MPHILLWLDFEPSMVPLPIDVLGYFGYWSVSSIWKMDIVTGYLCRCRWYIFKDECI